MVKPIPEGFHAVSPFISFKDAAKAIEFYKRAFSAKERFRMPGPQGKGVMHAELQIGDSIMMLSDESPQGECRAVESYGGSPIGFYLYVADADAVFKRAVEAGAKAEMPMMDAFWGDRCGTVKDPFGLTWTVATHTKDVSPEQMKKGAEAFYAAGAGRHS